MKRWFFSSRKFFFFHLSPSFPSSGINMSMLKRKSVAIIKIFNMLCDEMFVTMEMAYDS